MTDFTHKLTYSKKEVSDYIKLSGIDLESLQGQPLWRETVGGHLRISKSNLADFFQQMNIPLPSVWQQALQPLKVLIVDDEVDLLEIMADLLEDESRIVIRSEKNGFNAEIQLQGWKPDLLLLDFLMTGITGFEVCKRLRNNPDFSDLPILAITSLTTSENRSSVLEAGVSDFLGKPFYSENLLSKVRDLLALDKESF